VETLSRREKQIVDALLAGCTNKEIAQQLGVSDQTVKNQLTTLYKKMGVSSRLELVLLEVERRGKQNGRE
jgi:RNA polymerase sigma factor (sigma-70 family)